MNLTEMSIEALKAAWLDNLLQIEQLQGNILQIRQELVKRQKPLEPIEVKE